jgi:RimJ/RimL family protein N-acetyltransferase
MIDGDRLPTLTGARVRLRWLDLDDAADLYAVFSDPQVMRYWSRPPFTTGEEARALVRDIHALFRKQTLFQWGLARLADDRVLGTCTLSDVEPAHRRAQLGYALGRAHWGQGLMQEALTLLVDYAFDRLALHRLEADVDPRNVPSVRTLERLGFIREGYLRERWHVGGEIQDAAYYGLLAREWRARR